MDRSGPISPHQLSKLAPREWNRAIAAIAARQHGLVTLAQLTAIGISPSAVRQRAGAGSLHRIHRSVFAVGTPRLRAEGVYLAAVLACGPGSVLSHQAAAAHAGFCGSDATVIDVISPNRTGRRPGIRVHRTCSLPSADVRLLDGVPTTTVARTIVDLAGVLRPGPLEYAIHQAQYKRLVTLTEIARVVDRFPTRAGTAALRRIVGAAVPGEERAASPLERCFLRLCRQARLPLPRVNEWIALQAGGGLEVDFCWRRERLIVETDGAAAHETARAAENDPRRDRLLMRAGWRVARFTYRDVTERPREAAAELRALLRSGPISTAEAA